MTPIDFVNACSGLANAELGALGAHCPYCQGYFEILPANGRLDLGYCAERSDLNFDVAQSLPFDRLEVSRTENPPSLILTAPDQRWVFQISELDE